MAYYAVIDTNVLVSAMLKWDSVPGNIMEFAFEGPIIPILNDAIVKEYRDVLSRSKFHLTEEIVNDVMDAINEHGIYVDAETIDIELPDPKDRVFDEVVMEERKEENAYEQYDVFTAQYGILSSNANRRAFQQDSSYCLLASLEVLDEEGNLERKADIFTKRTIRKAEPVTSVDTASEALAVSIGERAGVDLPFMAQLSGKTEEEIIKELSGVIFRNPLTDQYETSDAYLSGNVREKLRIAKQFAESDPSYAINVDYLEKVQPKELDASEIEVRLGATWIKPEYVQEFMADLFQTPWYLLDKQIKVRYSKVSGEWNISGKSRDSYGNSLVTSSYGTNRANAYRLLEDSLNLKDTKIYDTIPEKLFL